MSQDMKAEESELVTRKGKYPDGLTHVVVLAKTDVSQRRHQESEQSEEQLGGVT